MNTANHLPKTWPERHTSDQRLAGIAWRQGLLDRRGFFLNASPLLASYASATGQKLVSQRPVSGGIGSPSYASTVLSKANHCPIDGTLYVLVYIRRKSFHNSVETPWCIDRFSAGNSLFSLPKARFPWPPRPPVPQARKVRPLQFRRNRAQTAPSTRFASAEFAVLFGSTMTMQENHGLT